MFSVTETSRAPASLIARLMATSSARLRARRSILQRWLDIIEKHRPDQYWLSAGTRTRMLTVISMNPRERPHSSVPMWRRFSRVVRLSLTISLSLVALSCGRDGTDRDPGSESSTSTRAARNPFVELVGAFDQITAGESGNRSYEEEPVDCSPLEAPNTRWDWSVTEIILVGDREEGSALLDRIEQRLRAMELEVGRLSFPEGGESVSGSSRSGAFSIGADIGEVPETDRRVKVIGSTNCILRDNLEWAHWQRFLGGHEAD